MQTEIKFEIELDENKVPNSINWEAENGKSAECKAAMIAVWDKEAKNTMRVDLWTKDMMVDEMNQFFHQNLLTMADTFERATGEEKMAHAMRDFCEYFAEKLNLISKNRN